MISSKIFRNMNQAQRLNTSYLKQRVDQLMSKHLFSSYNKFRKSNTLMAKGHLQFLYDNKDKKYLDLLGGKCAISVGHSHPKIIQNFIKQSQKLLHTSSLYLNQYQGLYAKALVQKCPQGIDHIYFQCSGVQAINTAVSLMRIYTNKLKLYRIRNSYHGNNQNILSNINHHNNNVEKGYAIESIPFPCQYRANYKGKSLSQFYIKQTQQSIRATSSGKIAGFISQPIMGQTGIYPLPQGYMKNVFKFVKQYKGLTVTDQSFSGFGRLGSSYWGCLDQQAIPDIMILSKSIGNGFPLAAVATSKQIASAVNKKNYFTTFAADPISCVIGIQTLKIIEQQKLQLNSYNMGLKLFEGLQKIKKKSRTIGDIRGKGLLIGIEFVRSPQNKQPNQESLQILLQQSFKRNLIMGKCGFLKNVCLICPPMCINNKDVQYVLEVIDDIVVKHNL